jgi:Na+/glutamate symporter
MLKTTIEYLDTEAGLLLRELIPDSVTTSIVRKGLILGLMLCLAVLSTAGHDWFSPGPAGTLGLAYLSVLVHAFFTAIFLSASYTSARAGRYIRTVLTAALATGLFGSGVLEGVWPMAWLGKDYRSMLDLILTVSK